MNETPSGHFTSREFFRYFSRLLSAEEAAAMEIHLAECDRCVHRARRVWFSAGGPGPALEIAPAVKDFVVPAKAAPRWQAVFGENLAWQPARALAAIAVLGVVGYGFWMVAHSRTPAAAPLRIVVKDNALTARQDGAGKLVIAGTVPPELDQPVRDLIDLGAADTDPAIKAAIERGREAIRRHRTPAGSRGKAPTLETPATTVVGDIPALFRWTKVNHAHYTLYIRDSSGNVQEVSTTKHELLTNAGNSALQPGQEYTWWVVASTGRGKGYSGLAAFVIPDKVVLDTVASLERRFADSPLLLTALYETYGFYQKAADQIAILSGLQPDPKELEKMETGLQRLQQ